MTKTYYLDTCIWRDFFEERFSKAGKPFGKYAAKLFMKIITAKDRIFYSDSLVWELKKDYGDEDIENMLSFLFAVNILVKIEITKDEYEDARILSKQRNLPFIDCLHALQARNHNAIMVSQDEHFINGLADIVKTKRTEEIN